MKGWRGSPSTPGKDAFLWLDGSCKFGDRPMLRDPVKQWRCDFTMYELRDGRLPIYKGKDLRGHPSAKKWHGNRRPPRFGKEAIVLRDFSPYGNGDLLVTCPTEHSFANGTFGRGCKLSWANEFIPEHTYFNGVCGETVEMPGLYTKASPKD